MKKILTIILIICSINTAKACDICGCGIGNNYIGLMPEFKKRIVGTRFRYNSLYTHLGRAGKHTHLTTNEHFYTSELWAGWQFVPRWRTIINLPVNFIAKKNATSESSILGLGDASFIVYRELIQQRKNDAQNNIWSQSLWTGLGLKIPTGKYSASNYNELSSTTNSFQLGTGSFDAMIVAMYDLRMMDYGWSSTVNYKINTRNAMEYRYGNKISVNSLLYHKWRFYKHLSIAPNLGLQWENSTKDYKNDFEVLASAGNLLMFQLGMESNWKRFAFGCSYQTPLHQNLAHQIVAAKDRFMLHFALSF